MRVGFFTNSSKMGGAEHSLVDVFKVCQFEKTLISLSDGELIDRIGPLDCRVFRGDKGNLTSINKILFLKKQFSVVDIVYANGNKAFLMSALIKLFLLGRYKIIWHVRDAFNSSHFGPIRYAVGFLTWLVGARIIYNSEYSRQSLVSSYGRDGTVVYNGFDPEVFEVNPSKGLPNNIVRMVSTSRISPWKGQLELIVALSKVKSDFELTMCGDSLFGEDAYLEEVKQKVIELDLSDKIKFLGHVDDIPRLLTSGMYDLVVHTSILPEPFGRCIVESVLAGLPVVASEHGGVKEIVGDNPAAFLFDPNKPEDLTRILDIAIINVSIVSGDLNVLREKVSRIFSMAELEIKINREIGKCQM